MATAGIRKGYVDVPIGQVHYREAGRGHAGWPLLLLHQSPSASSMWNPVLPGFASSGLHAIALDMPGFGESSPLPEEPQSIRPYADTMLAAATALGIERFDLLGHHTGATVAMQMAVDAPARVRKLALWGVPLLPPERLQRLATEAAPTYDDAGDEIVRYWRMRAAMSGPRVTPELRVRCLIEMLQTGQHRPWGHRAVGKTDHEALAHQITQPTYCLAAEREGLLEATRQAAALIRNAEFYSFPDAGLDIADEHPEAFVRLVADWLRKE